MSGQHSLPHSPQTVNTHRLSQSSSQLPLPSGLNAPAPGSHRPYPTNRTPTPPTLTLSLAGTNTPTSSHPRSPTSPPSNISTFQHHQQPSAPVYFSSTHAGGIQPSASFFRPSRPDHQQPQYSRPHSATSDAGPLHVPDPDVFQLAPLTKHISNSSDEQFGSMMGAVSDSTTEGQFAPLKRVKKSREPLLPIGGRPNLSQRPSLIHERSQGGNRFNGGPSNPLSATRGTATGRMRSSIDRVFTFGRGLSFDSIRKSTSTRNATPEGRMTFEGKPHDEESGFPLTPTISATRQNNSPSPVNFSQSLNVASARLSPLQPTLSPSPAPSSYMPTPPPHNGPPLSAIPIIDPSTGKPMRNYQRHPSRNRFFLQGRILTGGDSPWPFIGSLLVILTISGVWIGTTSVWWWENESPAVTIIGAYLCLITISTMLATVSGYSSENSNLSLSIIEVLINELVSHRR